MMEVHLTAPASAEELKKLRAGDRVLLSGIIYTARDQAHLRMCECLAAGKELPFPIKDSAIYYVGPTPARPDRAAGSAGPTTSGRMDSFSPQLLDAGNRIMIGKGRRSDMVKESIVRNGGIYLAALGGAGALASARIKSSELLAWEDLGCEAVRKLTVEDFPLTVIIDSEGNDYYDLGPEQYRKSGKG